MNAKSWNEFELRIPVKAEVQAYLTNLKSIMEGGIDLRNRDETIGRVVTA